MAKTRENTLNDDIKQAIICLAIRRKLSFWEDSWWDNLINPPYLLPIYLLGNS